MCGAQAGAVSSLCIKNQPADLGHGCILPTVGFV